MTPERRAGERVYRALLLLYPPSFRREYGEEMLRCSRDARRDHLVSWPRLLGDLLLTVPRRHLEVISHMRTTNKLLLAVIVVTVGIVGFAAVGGALAALTLMLVLAWVLLALLKERGTTTPTGFWWKLTLTGAGVFALVFAIFAPPWPQSWRESVDGELAWWFGFLAVSFAIVCMAAGLLAGLVELTARRRATR